MSLQIRRSQQLGLSQATKTYPVTSFIKPSSNPNNHSHSQHDKAEQGCPFKIRFQIVLRVSHVVRSKKACDLFGAFPVAVCTQAKLNIFARRQNKSAATPVAIGILRRCFPTTLDMWFGLELGSIVSHEDCTTDTPVEDNSKKCRFAICWESVMPRERLQCGAVSSRLRVVCGCFNPTILTQ